MSNYDENDKKSIAKFVVDNLPRHKQFALSTVDEQGNPWTVCVNLAFDELGNFIWKSQIDTEHSKNISRHPIVSIVVFSETEGIGDFGYYCKATAHEVVDQDELEKLLKIRSARQGKPMPPIDEYSGSSTARLYYAEVQAAWVNDDRHLKLPVDLDTLKVFMSE